MRLKNIIWEKAYLYRDTSSDDERKVIVIAISSKLKYPEGNVSALERKQYRADNAQLEVLVEFEDGSQLWTQPRCLIKTWQGHKDELIRIRKLEKIHDLDPHKPTDDHKYYWGSSLNEIILDPSHMKHYKGPKLGRNLRGNALKKAEKEVHLKFATPVELWFANKVHALKLDFRYEPRLFVFAEGKGFCPDFYIPKFDLFVELSASRYKDGRQKRSKLRRMKTQYENINVLVLYWEDLLELSEKLESRWFGKRRFKKWLLEKQKAHYSRSLKARS